MLAVWRPIFDKFRHGKADEQWFVDHFGSYMRSSAMQLEDLTGVFPRYGGS